jgi:hypothetical protein
MKDWSHQVIGGWYVYNCRVYDACPGTCSSGNCCKDANISTYGQQSDTVGDCDCSTPDPCTTDNVDVVSCDSYAIY